MSDEKSDLSETGHGVKGGDGFPRGARFLQGRESVATGTQSEEAAMRDEGFRRRKFRRQFADLATDVAIVALMVAFALVIYAVWSF